MKGIARSVAYACPLTRVNCWGALRTKKLRFFCPPRWLIRVHRSGTKKYRLGAEEGKLSRIYFDRHIYIPLLLEQQGIQVSPPGLTSSEEQFVRDLGDFWKQEKCGALAGKELFLLRNLSRGKGVGFFEGRGFYPDFIVWILEPSRKHQRIVFIEPHGMVYAKAYIHDEKARLHEYLRKLSKQLWHHSSGWKVELDSYLVSATRFEELHPRYDDGTWSRAKFAQHHILFPERNHGYDYLRFILAPPR